MNFTHDCGLLEIGCRKAEWSREMKLRRVTMVAGVEDSFLLPRPALVRRLLALSTVDADYLETLFLRYRIRDLMTTLKLSSFLTSSCVMHLHGSLPLFANHMPESGNSCHLFVGNDWLLVSVAAQPQWEDFAAAARAGALSSLDTVEHHRLCKSGILLATGATSSSFFSFRVI